MVTLLPFFITAIITFIRGCSQSGLYHDFNVEAGTDAMLIGEVSQCNDDNADNRFYEKMGRFPTIEEDEAPYLLLCNEYPPAK